MEATNIQARNDAVKEQIRQLQSTRDEQHRRQHVADVLTDKHEYGVGKILKGYLSVSNDETFDEIVQLDKEWVTDVLQAMRELACTKQQIRSVETLGEVPSKGYVGRSRINHRASEISARLERLQKIIDKYADG